MIKGSRCRGLVRLRLADLAGARSDFDLALSKDPDSSEGYYGRAIAKHRSGYLAQAAQDRQKALEIDPTVEEDFVAHGLTELHPQPNTQTLKGAKEAAGGEFTSRAPMS
ncbi:MAG: hypothetical protein ABR588_05875 [Sphingomicrobium sp.]|nr:hypothetical protein [Sphingomonadales bacterium]